MNDDLAARILSWMAKTGYPLELSIGRVFQEAGWVATYSSWYRDTETQKPRELDVRASITATQKRSTQKRLAAASVSLCIECKSSRDKPWVALGAGIQLGDFSLEAFLPGESTRMALLAARSEHVEVPVLLPPETPRVGGIVHAFDGEKDSSAPASPYSAVRQIRSAVTALDVEAFNSSVSASTKYSLVNVLVPLVILEGRLFEYSVQPDLSAQVREVEAVVVTVPHETDADDLAAVPVITRSLATTLAASFGRSAREFCTAMLPYADLVVGALALGRLPTPEESRQLSKSFAPTDVGLHGYQQRRTTVA